MDGLLLGRIRDVDHGGGGTLGSHNGDWHVTLRGEGGLLWHGVEDGRSQLRLLLLLLLLRARIIGLAASLLLKVQGLNGVPLDGTELLLDRLDFRN